MLGRSRGIHLASARQTLCLLALLAVLFRAFVAQGYMLTPAQEGRFLAISLCATQNPAMPMLDLATGAIVDARDLPAGGHDGEGGHGGADNPPCAFATLGALALPEMAEGLPVTWRGPNQCAVPASSCQPGRGLAAPPPWPTGPPILV